MTLGTRIAVMDGGRLQQAGAPMDIYRAPATRFVASFIGSPEMNFLPLSGMAAAGRDWLEQRFDSHALRTGVVLGLRPEELELVTAGEAEARSPLWWRGVVQRVERLGAEAHAQVRLEGPQRDVLVRTAPDIALQVGQAVVLAADPARVRVFDEGSGRALAARA